MPECICVCHSVHATYAHDTKCCDEMNGLVKNMPELKVEPCANPDFCTVPKCYEMRLIKAKNEREMKENMPESCCDGECNHDDCCGKIPENCTHKENMPEWERELLDLLLLMQVPDENGAVTIKVNDVLDYVSTVVVQEREKAVSKAIGQIRDAFLERGKDLGEDTILWDAPEIVKVMDAILARSRGEITTNK